MANTPMRTIRVPDELWDDYLKCCAYHGHNASADLRAFMEKVVAAVKPIMVVNGHWPAND